MGRDSKTFVQRTKVTGDTIEEVIQNVNRELDNLRNHIEEIRGYFLRGQGTPENEVAAKLGALYVNTNGGASTTLYIKESDNMKSSGWSAV